jgi:hypothetical protein
MAHAMADREEGEVARTTTDHAVSQPGRSRTRDLEARIRAMLRAERDDQVVRSVSKAVPRH